MAESGNLGQLKTQEWEHLQELADQLEEALNKSEDTDLTRFLPPAGSPHRLVFLHELIKTELEIRCRRSKTVSLDEYVRRYPELGSADMLPVDLVYEEYRVRHRFGDKPPLEIYERRFPKQYEQLKKREKQEPVGTIYNTVSPNTLVSPAPPPSTAAKLPESPLQATSSEPAAPDTLSNAPPLPSKLRVPVPPKASISGSSQSLRGGEDYQQLERIGKGQFGEVFRGLAPGGVPVAIKRIFRSMDDESSQRELKALERIRELRHPFLLMTHKFEPLEDRLIIVMELADGSLQERFKECREKGLPGIPVDELLAYYTEAAEALDYLREQKLAHRDIKPQNLLHLKGHAKVADFGVARSQENTVDHTMNVGGTPAYMPPEMWRGDISVHSDQYSFAVTWYEMRTGRRMFHGKTQVDIAHQHLTEKPDLSGVPEPEQKVLLRALAKVPDQRYPSCKDFVQALTEAVRPKEKTAPPPSPTRRWAIALMTVALTVTLSVLIGVLWKTLTNVRVDWQPQGWEPLTKDVEKDVDGGTYFRRLVKTINGQQVVMVLVKKEQAADPKTFYMMENKVWNDLYYQFATDLAKRSELQRYGENNKDTYKNEWLKGAEAPGTNRLELGVAGAQSRVPVFCVTVTEAYYFANWLGGKLPSRNQWIKAAGGDLGGIASR